MYDKIKVLVAAFAAVLVSTYAFNDLAKAQDWPPRQTSIVIGFGAGSSADRLVRIIAEGLQKRTGATFVVENKPGGGGNISVNAVANGPTDGSVILAAISAPLVVNPMMTKMSHNPLTLVQPLTIMADTASVIVASKKLGVKNFAEFRELLKKNPGKYTYSSVGVGTTAHFTMEMVADNVGSKMVHVPYRGTPETLQAVLQGDVDVSTVAVGTAISQIQADSVVPLAITASQRWPTLPDVPTIAEVGIPDMPVDSFVGLFLPAGVPNAIVKRMYVELKAVIDDPQARNLMVQAFYRPSGITPEEFSGVLRKEADLWRPVVGKLDLLAK